MRRNRGELRRDLDAARVDFFFELGGLDDLFLGVSVVEDAAGAELDVCAATMATHTNPPSNNAKQTNLRNPTTSF